MSPRHSILVSCLFATFLPAQGASVAAYGSSCGPTLSWVGLPRLGQSITFVYSGPNSYFDVRGIFYMNRPIFLMGVSDQHFGSAPLPIVLPTSMTNGQLGCTLLQSSELIIPMAWALPGLIFVDRIAIPIPNDQGLLGSAIFAQWMHWHRERPTLYQPWNDWITLSGAARATIGT